MENYRLCKQNDNLMSIEFANKDIKLMLFYE